MDEKIRINKYLSDIGVCSRREADRLTEAGRVTANGELVSNRNEDPPGCGDLY